MNKPLKPALRHLAIDLAIAATLLAASGAWGTRFWNTWTARGGQPIFSNYTSSPP